ncbi:glycosyltransferase family 2 protein [Sphingobacterium thalpophilum]|uniref:glycosyltransferase family 2 protein n=1 Tax=Sphingobacterium thalpophilum TaxID=259 RepID=UPI0024A697CC|nr:glycosyltransferase family 2 protein [Sphingobacterium thalpophilum]
MSQNQSNILKVTVGIVTFNAAKTLESTLQSIVNQTYRNIEIVVIDGGSTDGTQSILTKYDEVIHYWHSKKDKGIYDAMNMVTTYSQGDFLIFLGCDDTFYTPTVIEEFVAQAQADSRKVYYGDVFFLGDQRRYDGVFSSYKLALRGLSHQSIFYPKHLYKKEQYNLKYRYWADYYLNILLWGNYGAFQRIELIVANFNQDGQGSINVDQPFLDDKLNHVFKSLGILPALLVFLQRIKQKIFGNRMTLLK